MHKTFLNQVTMLELWEMGRTIFITIFVTLCLKRCLSWNHSMWKLL